jgi:hypothetical protein
MSGADPSPESQDRTAERLTVKSGSDEFSSGTVLAIVGIIGSLASLISVPLAIYFYLEAKEYPQLTYYVSPTKAIVVKVGQASKLTTSYNNKVIDTDITAAQVALWNAGRKSIKVTDILKPVVIHTDNATPILEATIRKESREVVQLALNTDELQRGRASVSWNILEQNDGGVIQLIYAGDTDVNITIDGVVEGQPIILQQSSRKPLGPEQQDDISRNENKVTAFAPLGMGIFSLLFVIGTLAFQKKRFPKFKEDWMILAMSMFLIILGSIFYFFPANIGPPFGF